MGRYPTAQLLQCSGRLYLLDCGEGTQMQLRRYHIKMQRIQAIFISHLHGDHYFGLLGLLNSMHLLGRTQPLTIAAPAMLQKIVRIQMDAGHSRFNYSIEYIETDAIHSIGEASELFKDSCLTVHGFPLRHRIPCTGFLFRQHQSERTYLPERGKHYGVRIQDIPNIKLGEDFIAPDGTVVPNDELTSDPPMARSYGYCTDTLPVDTTASYVQGADLLYHEATFAQAEQKRSRETFHSTAGQAAGIALRAKVSRLMIGHYSARYDNLDVLLNEAMEVFPNTILAREGQVVEI